jgi:superfamily II RNA helicase
MALIDSGYIKFGHSLDKFQIDAINGIDNKQNVFISAPTGSGKTLPALYSIAKAIHENKKIIYTSPLKTLSNQKFNEIANKIKNGFFKDITINDLGIETGDTKKNVDTCQIVVGTIEIFHNKMFSEPDYFNDIGYIIYDEAHYFSSERGGAWERTMIQLPQHIQLIMLSATVEGIPNFINWLDSIRNYKTIHCSTNIRHVPLTFSLYNANWDWFSYFYNTRDGNFKITKYNENYYDIKKQITTHKYNYKYVLNTLLNTMKQKELLPTIVYSFSRQKCESMPSFIETCFVSHKERAEIEKIYNYYMNKARISETDKNINQFVIIKKYLMKGVAFHTSGLIPFLKEIIEMLLEKKLIKVLFATETVATGLNIGFRSVVFTELQKYDSVSKRYLITSEFLQASGRAGRRGHDDIGHIIYTPLFYIENAQKFQGILCGETTHLVSKYNIDIPLMLKSYSNENITLLDDITEKSFIQYQNMLSIENNNKFIQYNKNCIELYNKYVNILTDEEKNILNEYHKGFNVYKHNLKDIYCEKNDFKNLNFENDILPIIKFNCEFYNCTIDTYNNKNTEISYSINEQKYNLIKYLQENEFISIIDDNIQLTKFGIMGSYINEFSPIVFGELYKNGIFDNIDEYSLLVILSSIMYTGNNNDNSNKLSNNISINDLKVDSYIIDNIKIINNIIENLNRRNSTYQYSLNLSFVEYIYLWAHNYNVNEVYGYIMDNYVFEGNFVKNILKINNMCKELIKSFEFLENNEFICIIHKAQELIMKGIVNIDSIYLYI